MFAIAFTLSAGIAITPCSLGHQLVFTWTLHGRHASKSTDHIHIHIHLPTAYGIATQHSALKYVRSARTECMTPLLVACMPCPCLFITRVCMYILCMWYLNGWPIGWMIHCALNGVQKSRAAKERRCERKCAKQWGGGLTVFCTECAYGIHTYTCMYVCQLMGEHDMSTWIFLRY